MSDPRNWRHLRDDEGNYPHQAGYKQPRGSESANDGVAKQCCDADIDLRMANIALKDAVAERDKYKTLAGDLAEALREAIMVGRVPTTVRIATAQKKASEAGL